MPSFPFISDYHEWTVPSGVTTVRAYVRGAAGGQQNATPAVAYVALGGRGAFVVCDLTVTPGETLRIYPGGMGDPGTRGVTPTWAGAAGHGGFNGGGNGGHVTNNLATQSAAGGGGGRSCIRRSPFAASDAIAIAAGGGGAGGNGSGVSSSVPSSGGHGLDVFPDGEDGHNGVSNAGSGGGGGTISAGGAGGTHAGSGANGTAGSAFSGGTGAGIASRGGGGGGGGLYGGGGGGESSTGGTSGGGGGGGSSFVDGTLIDSGVAPSWDHGLVIVSYAGGGWRLGKLGFGARQGGFS